jgi:GNAT superfamily N-acetyltransferase
MLFYRFGVAFPTAVTITLLIQIHRNHNWFQSLKSPIEPIKYDKDYKIISSLTALQKKRQNFYRALIKLTRLNHGDVCVSTVPRSNNQTINAPESENGEGEVATKEEIAAILLWLQPSVQNTNFLKRVLDLYNSGFLALILPWHYGFAGLSKVEFTYESNVHALFTETLAPRSLTEKSCGFVRMIAANPNFAGKGYASRLLEWRMQKHFEEHVGVPVLLDTSTAQGVRAYLRLGFELLGERSVDTGTNAGGFRLKGDESEEVLEEARKTCVQRVMIKLPPVTSTDGTSS